MQSRARLLGKPKKQLLSKAKDNQEWLDKGLKLQINKVANNQSSDRLNNRLRTIK